MRGHDHPQVCDAAGRKKVSAQSSGMQLAHDEVQTSLSPDSVQMQAKSLFWEFNMANSIDLHVGRRLRRRRRLMGMTQQQLADMVGIRFQQIQKYECGANRITASRLFELSSALSVAVQYFYDGLATIVAANDPPANDHDEVSPDVLRQKETLELVRAYYSLGERPRRRLLDLAKALKEDASDAA